MGTAPAPVSFFIPFAALSDQLRPWYLHDMAVNGIRHAVLNAPLISMIMAKPELLEAVQKELAAEGMSFLDSHTPYGRHWDMISPFPDIRRRLIAQHKLSMEIVAAANVDTMTIHVGAGHLYPDVTPETNFSNMCIVLEELLLYAEKLGITICVENGMAPSAATDVLLALREKFPVDNLGFCYDAGHANVNDKGRLYADGAAYNYCKPLGIEPRWENAQEKMERMLPHIVNCHLHDNDGSQDKHNLPWRGNVDWQSVVANLRKAPRLRVIQCEVSPLPNNVSVRETAETFRALFEKY